MVSFIQKRLQVFVSSTYTDLIADPDDLPAVNDLCLLGLLARQGSILELTDPGQRFLNRLLIEQRDNVGA